MLSYLGARYFLTKEIPVRLGTRHPSVVPYGEFAASDGALVVAILGEQFWPPLCRAIGRPDLQVDPRFATNHDRLAHRDELEAILADIFATRAVADWVSLLVEHDVPHAPIADVGEVLASDLFEQSGLRVAVAGEGGMSMDVIGTPVGKAGTGSSPQRVPALGEHNTAILGPRTAARGTT
jgi:formyl-CoA transferase/CoA:oxalate CoA-transferase